MRGFLVSVLIVFVAMLVSCAGSDDIKGVADAANRAAGGGADAATGSRQIDVAAGVSQTGDVSTEAWKVSAQRNMSNTAAGDQFTAVSMAQGSGQAAAERAIANDPVVKLIQEEIAFLAQSPAESRPTERLDSLRAELAARLKVLDEAHARSITPAVVHDVTQIVIAPSAIGRDQPEVTAADGELAKQISQVIDAAKRKGDATGGIGPTDPGPASTSPPKDQ